MELTITFLMGAYNAESDEDNMSEFVNINLKNLVNQNHVKTWAIFLYKFNSRKIAIIICL